MKKLVYMAFAATIFAGCSSDEKFEDTDNGPVEITFNPGISGMLTKAPVNTGDNITASFVATATDGDYSTNVWSATATFQAATSPSSALSFTPAQYYPVNGNPIYIKGYYPAGTLSGDSVAFSGANGTQDVMITGQASGTKTSTQPLAFTFNHLLAQLQFKFVSGTGYDPTGKTVTSVVVKSQKLPSKLSLSSGNMSYTSANVTISGTYTISQVGAIAADRPIVKAGEAVILSVTTSDGVTYPDVTISSLTTVVGQSHLITLTFTPKEITATVTVTAWVTGTGGSSPLQ